MKYEKDFKSIEVDLKDIKLNPKNPRKHYDNVEMEELKDSLQSMGQINNLVLDESGQILSGHRRYYAAKQLGWKTIRCDVKTALSEFEKSAVMISTNATQKHFNAWEHREAIAKIYWNEFLEEYTPKSSNDKGYSLFAKKLGLSSAHVKKIVEATSGKNKKLLERMKAAGVPIDAIDAILTSKEDLRDFLANEAIKKKAEIKDMAAPSKVRDFIRSTKKRALIETNDKMLTIREWKRYYAQIENFGIEFDEHLLDKSEKKDLKVLEQLMRKNVIRFYNKLCKHLGIEQ